MLLKIIAAVAALSLLCSCNAASLSGTESLLVAPKLNKRQTEISEALELNLSLRNIVYKSPQSGDYRSSFIFFDFNGDSMDEAIVFYSNSTDASGVVRAKILTQKSEGEWIPSYDIRSQSSGVDFVQFEKLLDTQSYCMIIGWRGAGRQNSSLEIFSMRGGVFSPEAGSEYLNYSIGDFDGNGLAEVVIIGQEGRGRYSAKLLSGRGGHIETIQSLQLSSEVESVAAITNGKWGAGGAVYIDELLSGGPSTTLATEIIGVSSKGLTLLCGGDEPMPDEEESAERSIYGLTFRDEDIYCMDLDGDDVVEIPYPISLPGEADIDNEPPKLMQLMHLTGEGFSVTGSAVINQRDGYLFYFPGRWKDKVTVEQAPESAEWRFRKWNTETFEAAEELLRIRVSSTTEYLDLFEDYIPLAAKGTLSYTAYLSKIPGEPLVLGDTEIVSLFKLLPS